MQLADSKNIDGDDDGQTVNLLILNATRAHGSLCYYLINMSE